MELIWTKAHASESLRDAWGLSEQECFSKISGAKILYTKNQVLKRGVITPNKDYIGMESRQGKRKGTSCVPFHLQFWTGKTMSGRMSGTYKMLWFLQGFDDFPFNKGYIHGYARR